MASAAARGLVSVETLKRELEQSRFVLEGGAVCMRRCLGKGWASDLNERISEFMPPASVAWHRPLEILHLTHMMAPKLPRDICHIMESPCSIWEGRTVQDTHRLVLFPGKVTGARTPRELISRCHEVGMEVLILPGPESGDESPHTVLDHPLPKPHWALVTKFPIPGTTGRDMCMDEREDVLRALCVRTGLPYQALTTQELVEDILMQQVVTRQHVFPFNDWSGYRLFGRCVGKHETPAHLPHANYSSVQEGPNGCLTVPSQPDDRWPDDILLWESKDALVALRPI